MLHRGVAVRGWNSGVNRRASNQQRGFLAKRSEWRWCCLLYTSVSKQQVDAATSAQAQAKAAYQQAIVERDIAKLNLDRSEVRASVNGPMTNFELRPGVYVTAGKGVAALIDTDSLHVDGYFEETKLSMIQVGDRAAVHLMGESADLIGHVEGIAGGIEDHDRSSGASLLANVNPTFSWARLAQRMPVRIALDLSLIHI